MSIYTLRSGGTTHPEDSVLQYLTDVVVASGVKDLSTDNHWKVSQKAGTPDLSVDVAVGRACVKGTATNLYPVRNTAIVNKTITGNSSGNPRIDAVIVYIDLAASPDATASNVGKLYVVAGTPAASPVAPTDAEIATAIGSSNPFLRLANVAVANGASQILDANITDKRVKFRISNQNRINYTDLSGATLTPDFSQYNIQQVLLDRASTVLNAPIGVSPDESIVLYVKEDAVGSRGLTFWADINWFGGAPTITATANHIDSFGFIKRVDPTTGAVTWDGMVIGQDKSA